MINGEQVLSPILYNKTVVTTYGPITPVLNFSYIRLTGGDSSQIQKIQRVLQSRILQFIIPFGRTVDVTDLNFSVDYPRKLPSLPLFRNFSYGTIYLGEQGNFSVENVPHQVIVNGFDGGFGMIRGKLLRFSPAEFFFLGKCSSVTIIMNGM